MSAYCIARPETIIPRRDFNRGGDYRQGNRSYRGRTRYRIPGLCLCEGVGGSDREARRKVAVPLGGVIRNIRIGPLPKTRSRKFSANIFMKE